MDWTLAGLIGVIAAWLAAVIQSIWSFFRVTTVRASAGSSAPASQERLVATEEISAILQSEKTKPLRIAAPSIWSFTNFHRMYRNIQEKKNPKKNGQVDPALNDIYRIQPSYALQNQKMAQPEPQKQQKPQSWKNYFKIGGVGAGIGTSVTAGSQGVLALFGFKSAGIAAGSVAASMQGPAVVAGSKFAIMQSIGATSAFVSAPVLLSVAAGGAAIGATAYALSGGGWNKVVQTSSKGASVIKDYSVSLFKREKKQQ